MRPNLISVFEMRNWPAVRAPQDFLPLLSAPCSPAPKTSAVFPGASCLVLMASRQICFLSSELACNAAFQSTSPTGTIYGAASSNDGKMNSHSLSTLSPGRSWTPERGSPKWSEWVFEMVGRGLAAIPL